MRRRVLFVLFVLFFCFVDSLYPQSKIIIPLQQATIKVANELKNSVVTISSLQVIRVYPNADSLLYELFPELFGNGASLRRIGIGSGVIIDKEGYILTNEHVLGPAKDILVTLPNGDEYHAKIVAVDYKADLAVIKINPKEELVPAKLGNSDNIKIGEWVMAIGNPFGIAFHLAEPTLTIGIVSAVHRCLPSALWRGRNYVDLIQTDAAINPGNSGGPLVNMKGEVIGINVAILSPSGGSIGLGFAIPINAAKRVINSAMSGIPISYGWIGLAGEDVSARLQKYFGLKHPIGVFVVGVVPGGPADLAGIKEGDVILKFDNKKIRDIQDLLKYISESKIGEKVPITILRGKNKHKLYVKIAKEGQGFVNPKISKQVNKKEFLTSGKQTTQELVNIRGMKLMEIGGNVVVQDVIPDSPADKAGIRRGDVILQINQNKIKGIDDLKKLVKNGISGNLLIRTNRGFFVIFSN